MSGSPRRISPLRIGSFSSGFHSVRVDLLTSISGVSWQEAYDDRQSGSYGGLTVDFIGRSTFVANRRASGRLRDLADLEDPGES